MQVYNLGTPDYYAVAVVKIRDNSSELIYLKRRNSCHTGVGQVRRIYFFQFENIFLMCAGCGLDHPDVVADQQRAGAGLWLRLGPRRRGVLPEGLRSRHQGQGLHAQQVGQHMQIFFSYKKYF